MGLPRSSGLLLHPTSLPGPHGNGDLGREAFAFVDFLARAEQRYWQMLPVGPPGYGNSPYSAESAFAGNPLLIPLEPLIDRGWLSADALIEEGELPTARVDYARATRFRTRALRIAFEAMARSPEAVASLRRFREEHRAWLGDFSMFRALKRAHGDVEWTRWAPEYCDRDPAALERAAKTHASEIAFEEFAQWLFQESFIRLRAYARERNIGLIGDIPIFVAHDSADVWAQRELFRLDERGMPAVVAGVPPDYFSSTGQRWGNPLYRWARIKQTRYAWWIDRFRSSLSRFDIVRIDHFIGFTRYWEIPANEATAVRGRWMKGPGADLFDALRRALGGLPLIAEDLGAVTPAVKRLRDRLGLPGIKVLQFAFGTDPSAPDFLPHHYARRAVVYTGTHDNDTTVGWFYDAGAASHEGTRMPEQVAREQRAALAYLGARDGAQIHWDMIRMAMLSVADTCIFPLQDVLGLGSEARMNRPGNPTGNWEWRVSSGSLTSDIAERLMDLTRTYGRSQCR